MLSRQAKDFERTVETKVDYPWVRDKPIIEMRINRNEEMIRDLRNVVNEVNKTVGEVDRRQIGIQADLQNVGKDVARIAKKLDIPE